MNEEKELKQVYNVFTAAWRVYKSHYPPSNSQDDAYWSKLVSDLHAVEAEYSCQLCRDILCNAAADLERKAKALYPSK